MGLSDPLEDESFADIDVPSPPPTNLWSDEPPMESHLHLLQVLVLLDSLAWHWQGRDDYFASGNLTVYYSTEQLRRGTIAGRTSSSCSGSIRSLAAAGPSGRRAAGLRT